MKILSLIGILLSVLGVILCYAVINNYVEYGDLLSKYLNLNHKEIKKEVFTVALVLDTGRNICFALILLFLSLLFLNIKIYQNYKQ